MLRLKVHKLDVAMLIMMSQILSEISKVLPEAILWYVDVVCGDSLSFYTVPLMFKSGLTKVQNEAGEKNGRKRGEPDKTKVDDLGGPSLACI